MPLWAGGMSKFPLVGLGMLGFGQQGIKDSYLLTLSFVAIPRPKALGFSVGGHSPIRSYCGR